ncbi:MAG: glycosyltransferase [Flavobacterium sp.]|nr:glycosyltransferase [Flavobacterium sp.]
MNFCIITHVFHTKENQKFYGYSPYVNEMNIWIKHVDDVTVVAPLTSKKSSTLTSFYNAKQLKFIEIKKLHFKNVRSIFWSILYLPSVCYQIFIAMENADHIHLRCPGNIGLMGCIIQIFFPKKIKTAKYAGNWYSNSNQPISYRIQKWILSNTFLTKNMQVLVYGEWENQSQNIKPFFTATYSESEKTCIEPRLLNSEIKFIFVGTLTEGKQPLFAIKFVEKLHSKGYFCKLSIYGDGIQKDILLSYVQNNNLSNYIKIEGNIDKEKLKDIYQQSNFLILPSKSEGWPKVIAEAMFWGCLPIATSVSCIPNMLDYNKRGVLISNNLELDSLIVEKLIQDKEDYILRCKNAINWSREFTTDKFESEIIKLIKKCE